MEQRLTKIKYKGRDALKIEGLGDFLLYRTLDCGQCFRWQLTDASAGEHIGVAHGRELHAASERQGELILVDVDEEEFERIWRRYFSLDRDWQAIRRDIELRSVQLREAAALSEGIRILSQEPYEALVSFIISQCNNIPRIKGLIRSLSEHYGERISEHSYTFPTAERILSEPLSSLSALKLGYRDEYIYSACRDVCDGIIERIEACPTTAEAERILTSMKGVGRKVASCVLLFGFGRLDAFPVDVWMKRALERNFGRGADISSFGDYRGVAQQYLFYAERYINAQ